MINYVDKTCRSFNKTIFVLKRDFKRADINNNLVKHNLETNPNFNLKASKMLVFVHNKKTPENGWF